MSELPVKATITIEIEAPNADEIGLAFQNAVDGISFGSSSGNGMTTNGSRYHYLVETNLPKEPMTVPRLFQMMSENLETDEEREAFADLIAQYRATGRKED